MARSVNEADTLAQTVNAAAALNIARRDVAYMAVSPLSFCSAGKQVIDFLPSAFHCSCRKAGDEPLLNKAKHENDRHRCDHDERHHVRPRDADRVENLVDQGNLKSSLGYLGRKDRNRDV